MSIFGVLSLLLAGCVTLPSETATLRRIRASLDVVGAIDTHDHLWPFEKLPGFVETDRGRGMTLQGLWKSSYLPA